MENRLETRTVRPFIGMDRLESQLSRTVLRVNGKAVMKREYFGEEEFEDLKIALTFDLDSGALALTAEEMGLSIGDFRLAVVARSLTIGNWVELRNWQLETDEIEDLDFHSQDLPNVFCDVRSGFEIVCALVLAKQRPQAPLEIYEKGTWLSLMEWKILPDREVSSFAPKGMDAKIKKDLNLSSKAVIFVEAKSESLWTARTLDEALTVWVDEDLLNMTMRQNSGTATMTEIFLARIALEALVNHVSRSLSREKSSMEAVSRQIELKEIDENVFTSFLKKVHKVIGTNETLEETLQQVVSEPAMVVSKMESAVDLRADLKRLLLKEDS